MKGLKAQGKISDSLKLLMEVYSIWKKVNKKMVPKGNLKCRIGLTSLEEGIQLMSIWGGVLGESGMTMFELPS